MHTLWRADNHETIHRLASRFAAPGPVPLFAEGFAVAHQVDPVKGDFAPNWNGRYLPERRGNPNDTEATVRSTFASVFGLTIEQVEADWLRAGG